MEDKVHVLRHRSQVKHINNLSRWILAASGKPRAMSEEKQPRKASSVRHTRAIQRDHTKHAISAPTAEEIQERLTEIVHPATLEQVNYFHSLGLRERSLGLAVMVAFVLETIWGQISGVNEMVRLIQTEAMLWASPRKVSQQALSQRLTSLPSHLFLNILLSILPLMQKRWAERTRPLPPEIVWAQERYSEVQAVDGSTLDALIRKIGLLKDLPQNPLAHRRCVCRRQAFVGSRLLLVWRSKCS